MELEGPNTQSGGSLGLHASAEDYRSSPDKSYRIVASWVRVL
jgi:hypothetical protein